MYKMFGLFSSRQNIALGYTVDMSKDISLNFRYIKQILSKAKIWSLPCYLMSNFSVPLGKEYKSRLFLPADLDKGDNWIIC